MRPPYGCWDKSLETELNMFPVLWNIDPLDWCCNNADCIVQKVEKLTDGAVRLSPGTMYGSLSKMEKDGLIRFVREVEKRKIYHITPLGTEVLELEMARIERLYRNMKEARA